MKKKIKIYTHHNHYEKVVFNKPFRVFEFGFKLITGLLYGIYELLFLVGSSLIYVFTLPKKFSDTAEHLPEVIHTAAKKTHISEFRRTLAIFTVLVVVASLLVQSGRIIAAGQSLKGKVLGTSDEGLKYIQDAQHALENQDINRAQDNFSKALAQFERSEQELRSSSVVLKGVLAAIPQKRDADQLLEAAQLMTDSAVDATAAIALTRNIKVSPEGLSGVDNPKEMLENLRHTVEKSTANILRASALLNDVSLLIIPEQHRQSFLQVRDTLSALQGSMVALRDTFDILTSIALGKKNVLLIFQNNNELRATGGFIGTVGLANITDGQIKSLDIRSVYDFDGQMQEWILPPKPMYAVNNRWYLRDSNWFADFKASSSRIMAMYEKEGGETPDMVMAITPDLIIDLLKTTGPITLPQHNVTLNSDNFIETTQTTTSIAYSKELNQPKQLLADFFPVLMQRLGTTEQGIIPLLTVLQSNLHQKNVLLFARDESLQNKIESFNWGGRVSDSDRDYLSVVSSNLGGTKTDRVLQKKPNLQSEIKSNGTIQNTLKFTVKNPLPEQHGLENTSFVRFLVPKGAKLIRSDGFDDNPLPRLSGEQYTSDSQVENWERALSQDQLSGMYLGEESGKTLFGNWIKVNGSESKTVTIVYELPFKIQKLDRHSLLLQKQSGSMPIEYEYIIHFAGRSLLWKNEQQGSLQDKSITYTNNLRADNFIGLVFTKN